MSDDLENSLFYQLLAAPLDWERSSEQQPAAPAGSSTTSTTDSPEIDKAVLKEIDAVASGAEYFELWNLSTTLGLGLHLQRRANIDALRFRVRLALKSAAEKNPVAFNKNASDFLLRNSKARLRSAQPPQRPQSSPQQFPPPQFSPPQFSPQQFPPPQFSPQQFPPRQFSPQFSPQFPLPQFLPQFPPPPLPRERQLQNIRRHAEEQLGKMEKCVSALKAAELQVEKELTALRGRLGDPSTDLSAITMQLKFAEAAMGVLRATLSAP